MTWICGQYSACSDWLILEEHYRRGSRILKWGVNFLHLNQRNQILFQYLRDKKKRKKGAQKKGGENSPISPPLDPRLHYSNVVRMSELQACLQKPSIKPYNKQLINLDPRKGKALLLIPLTIAGSIQQGR